MRAIPEDLQARLDAGATTLCRCWNIERRDGVRLGFTDHDGDLTVDGLSYQAGTGFDGTEYSSRLGLSGGGGELHGALASEGLEEADLAAGRWDGAAVTLLLVDWSQPTLFLPLLRGELGEVKREGPAFIAEVRTAASKLDVVTGRRYAASCDSDLGDSRCGVDLENTAHRGLGAVEAMAGNGVIIASGLSSFDDGLFCNGLLTWMSGSNSGLSMEVKAHRLSGDVAELILWETPSVAAAAGDEFVLVAGCDKRFETCRDRFANARNFRGFPHIPGNDFALGYAAQGDANLTGEAIR